MKVVLIALLAGCGAEVAPRAVGGALLVRPEWVDCSIRWESSRGPVLLAHTRISGAYLEELLARGCVASESKHGGGLILDCPEAP